MDSEVGGLIVGIIIIAFLIIIAFFVHFEDRIYKLEEMNAISDFKGEIRTIEQDIDRRLYASRSISEAPCYVHE